MSSRTAIVRDLLLTFAPPRGMQGITMPTALRSYWVYILSSRSRTLYTGMTNDLELRVKQHKEKIADGFTSKYNINRLVCFEGYNDVKEAIFREKQIKAWDRYTRVALIESMNPAWDDLSADWYLPNDGAVRRDSEKQVPRSS
jgi:putative endonuclease